MQNNHGNRSISPPAPDDDKRTPCPVTADVEKKNPGSGSQRAQKDIESQDKGNAENWLDVQRATFGVAMSKKD